MSPKNKDRDGDFDEPEQQGAAPAHDEIIDAEDYSEEEAMDSGEGLRAPRAADDTEEDYGDFDESAEDEEEKSGKKRKRARGSGSKGLIVTGIIFAGAASAGVYLGLNPAIMAGFSNKPAPVTVAAGVVPDTLPQPVPVQSDFASLPQPVAPQNDIAPPPMPGPEAAPPLAEIAPDPAAPVDPSLALAAAPEESAPVEPLPTEPVPAETMPAAESEPAMPLAVAEPTPTPVEAPLPDPPLPVEETQQQEQTQVLAETSNAAELPATPPALAEILPVPAETTPPAPAAETPPVEQSAGFVPSQPPPTDMPAPVVEAAGSVLPPALPPAEAPAIAAPGTDPTPSLAAMSMAPTAAPEGQFVPPPAESGQAAAPVRSESPLGDSDVYYDSALNVPTGSLATSVGPREVNPVMEPASKMVIVKRDAGPDSFDAMLVSAGRALKLGRHEAALEMYNLLYKKNPRDERVVMGRAVAQQHAGLIEGAIRSYEELLALAPGNKEATVNMMGLLSQQYPEVALRRLIDLYRENPQNAGIAAQIGITSAKVGQYEEAMRYLEIAASIEPTNAEHVFNMAIASDRRGNKDQAVKLYERALELDAVYGQSRSVPRTSIYDRLSVLRRG